ncbi:MAG: hypothetical protein IPK18_12990 [Sphingobacteriales bacterium]|jgi:hypothetical protein|nr:MAG: hypothetical protein IPK18_12990 [Sphingobacteriales bacterium]
MLQLKFSKSARETLNSISLFVDNVNTIGAGSKWKDRFIKSITKYAVPVKYALCRHHFLASKEFSCISIGNWIIVFKITDEIFLVDKIIHTSLLK